MSICGLLLSEHTLVWEACRHGITLDDTSACIHVLWIAAGRQWWRGIPPMGVVRETPTARPPAPQALRIRRDVVSKHPTSARPETIAGRGGNPLTRCRGKPPAPLDRDINISTPHKHDGRDERYGNTAVHIIASHKGRNGIVLRALRSQCRVNGLLAIPLIQSMTHQERQSLVSMFHCRKMSGTDVGRTTTAPTSRVHVLPGAHASVGVVCPCTHRLADMSVGSLTCTRKSICTLAICHVDQPMAGVHAARDDTTTAKNAKAQRCFSISYALRAVACFRPQGSADAIHCCVRVWLR